MKKTNDNEKGFSAVEVILVIVIVALVGVIGWMVYKNNNKLTPTAVATTKPSEKTTIGSSATPSSTPNSSVTDALAYGQQAKGITLQIDNGKATVDSALYATYFGNSAIDNEGAIVSLNVSNNTTSVQTYDLSNFSVQLPDGQVVDFSSLYGVDGDSTTVTLAPSGNTSEYLIFAPVSNADTAGKGLLIYTSPSTSDTVTAAIVLKTPFN